jgi:hypothetical protein
MKKLLFILSLFVLTFSVKAQNVNSTYVNSLLGAGVNGYNMFSGDAMVWPDSVFTSLKAKGFSSVRLVYIGPQDPITSATLLMLKDAVDKCLAAGLIPVIDFHIPPSWFAAYTAEEGATFVSNWSTTAAYFSSYTYTQLVLELVNEPSSIATSTWNTLCSNAVAAIRAQDPDRVVMLSPLTYGHIEGLDGFVLPNYDNLILSIHYYSPPWVINQNVPWEGPFYGLPYSGTHWRNIQPMINNLEDQFTPVFDFQDANDDIPVNIGEWGTWIFADSVNRVKYANLLCRWFETKGWSHWVWEYDDYFGIVRNPTLGYDSPRGYYTDLSEAITTTPLVLDSYDSTVVLEDNFSSIGTWHVDNYGTGYGSVSVSGGELVINVTATDWDAQHVRVKTPVFDLYHDSIYRVSYKAKTASGTKDIAHRYKGPYYPPEEYQGPYHDWYNTLDLGSVWESRSETSIMPFETQMSTDLEILVGMGTGIMYLKDFKIEKLTIIPTVTEEDTCDYHVTIYDTVAVADSAQFLFENNFTATYGTPTITNHSTTFSNTAGQYCQGSYCMKTDIYQSYAVTSSITMADSFNISIYYRAWYTSGTILSNFGATGSGFALNRGGSNIQFITTNGTTDDTLFSDPVISNGNCYLIEIRARRSTGVAQIWINGVNETNIGDIVTDFSLSGAIGLGASNTGSNQSWSYLDQFEYSTFSTSVVGIDSCVMAIGDTILATDTLWCSRFDGYNGTSPYAIGVWCTPVADTMIQLYEQEYLYWQAVDFNSENYMRFSAQCINSTNEVEIRIDSIDGQLLGYINDDCVYEDCSEGTINFTGITGIHKLYIINNSPGQTLYNFNWLLFYSLTNVPKKWTCNYNLNKWHS